ncbi:MAG TPA: FtsX-like permease family protein [Candidatus Dormibacteraeota bacterium]|nr:FtsX-like permease family protein [Candidatus Dormibacteraeota bacterium]
MRALNRKLVRDLWHLRGQMIAIALVVACGVAVFVSTRAAYESLLMSRDAYYAEYRFADVFVHLKRAPDALAARLARIPGVASVQPRIVFDVTLDVPGLAEPATGRLQSIPERRVPILNDLHLRRGRWVEPGRRDEVIVSEAFANANHLEIGDTLGAILNGRWENLRVVGIALSPEYVYEIRGGDIFPDNRRFGVLWMSRDVMGPAFDMDGAFNDVVLSLAPGASEAEVIAQLDRRLDRYGGLRAVGRDKWISDRFLSDEIAENEIFGTVLPAIFLGVAAFLLNIVLSRLVATQRDQIAVLKAFGYRHWTVAAHYLGFAAVAVALGSALGTACGIWLGMFVNRMYVDFFRFPVLRFEAGPTVIGPAIAIAGAAALLGAWAAARRALALPPAEAMRPESPPNFHAGPLERAGLRDRLPAPARMILRNIARRPARALAAIVGMALAVAILIVSRYFVDAIQYLADVQFRLVQRDDVTLGFQDALPERVRYELAHLPGVRRAEPFRSVPADLRFEHRSRRVGLTGLDADSELHRLIDERLRPVAVPADGVLLTRKLAEVLDVHIGDQLTVEVLEGSRPRRAVRVAGTVDELIGFNAYMDRRALHRLMREEGGLSGAFLTIDPSQAPRLYGELKRMPAVAGVSMRQVALRSFEDTVARSMGIFINLLVGFACVVAMSIVYNAARIALSERGRELASLRVLGFTRREVAVLLLGEQALLTVLAVPLGYVIGYQTCMALARLYQRELFRLPMVMRFETYAFALLVLSTAALGSAWLVRRRLDRIDLVEVLKTRE